MSELTTIEVRTRRERAKVESWRLHVLIQAGYPLPLAEQLAGSEADLHSRVELVVTAAATTGGRGRDPALALGSPSQPAWHAGTGEGRGGRVRRPQGLLRRVVQPGRRVWLARLPTVWVEGEVTELRRQERWADASSSRSRTPTDGACLAVDDAARPVRRAPARARRRRARARLRPSRAVRGARRLPAARALDRALRPRRAPRGARAAEAAARRRGPLRRQRKRPLPRSCRAGSGSSPATTRPRSATCSTTISARFPPARVLVAETYVQGPRAAPAIVEALRALCAEPGVDVIVLARGGGSFEDLLPFSDERLVRAVAPCPGAGRLGRRARAGHAALRPRRRRARVDADRGGDGSSCPTCTSSVPCSSAGARRARPLHHAGSSTASRCLWRGAVQRGRRLLLRHEYRRRRR